MKKFIGWKIFLSVVTMTSMNNAALRMLQRAQSMKQKNDDTVVVKHPSLDEQDQNEPLLVDKKATDDKALESFTSKYGVPFSFNHSQKNGTVPSEHTNEKAMFNNNFAEKAFQRSSTKDGGTARDRFRRAGMKARFARRMEKIVEDRMTVRQIFNRYVQNSTLHGFRFIFMKTFVVRRVIWALLTIAMAIIFFTELGDSVDKFFEYPFTTTSTIEYVPNLKFPAISICNLNSFQLSKVKNSKLNKLYTEGHLPFEMNFHDPGYDIPGNELFKVLRNISQPIKDLFRSCEWKSRDTAKTGKPNTCNSQNFSTYSNLYGQSCYTFNPGDFGHRLLSLNETGLNMALKLELDINAMESLKGLQEVGLQIVVHDQDESPLQQSGFVVSPGFQTFVEMRVRKTENLKPPYATKCGERKLEFSSSYRQSMCFLEQLSNEVRTKCRCRGAFNTDDSLPFCSLNQTITCLIPTVHQFDRKTNGACPVDCETTQYLTSLSYGRFLSHPPIGTGILRHEHSYIEKLRSELSTHDFQKYISENLVVVQFFYQEMKEENVQQEPSYDFYKLVGDVGGQLGLMLGASVLTLVEFVDLFFFTLYHQVLRLSRNKQKTSEARI